MYYHLQKINKQVFVCFLFVCLLFVFLGPGFVGFYPFLFIVYFLV